MDKVDISQKMYKINTKTMEFYFLFLTVLKQFLYNFNCTLAIEYTSED